MHCHMHIYCARHIEIAIYSDMPMPIEMDSHCDMHMACDKRAIRLPKAIGDYAAMPVISIANPKGGAGKSTLALVLADQLAEQGAKLAVIDADPNAFLGRWGAKRTESSRQLPYHIVERPKEEQMVKTIEALSNDFDFIIVDLEGSASRMTSRALARSHMVLIPFNQSPVDAELAAKAVALVEDEAHTLSRTIPFRLVRSRENAAIATKSAKRIAAAIAEADLPVLSVGLVERAAYRDIYEQGALLSELNPTETSGIANARENARALSRAVVEAIQQEYQANE